MRLADPPLYAYEGLVDDEMDYVLFQPDPEEPPTPAWESLSSFILSRAVGAAPDAGEFSAIIHGPGKLGAQLDAALPVRIPPRVGWGQEGNGLLASFSPARQGGGFELAVKVHPSTPWQKLPEFLWPHARQAYRRSGMFTTAPPMLDEIR